MRYAGSTGLLVISFLLPALAWRGLLLWGEVAPLGMADGIGLMADLGVALALSTIAATMAWLWEPLAVVLAVLHSLLWWANYEQVVALDGSLLLGYIDHMADTTFLVGSVLTVSQPWLGLGLLPVAGGLSAWALRRGEALNGWVPLAVALPLISLSTSFSPTVESPLWRQENFLAVNVETALRKGPLDTPGASFEADLEGTRHVPDMPRGTNVLLVVLEGFSGGYLGPIATAAGRPDIISTPALDSIATSGLAYTQFVANQRQTNRGLYALLCGDYPNLGNGTPHMNKVVHMGGRRCLPRVLAENGYHTLFAQAAPLEFQGIGQFAEGIGYQEAVGGDWFKDARERNEWGVDDKSFFEQSEKLIDDLDAQEEPWFVTLVTSGTHHPFNTIPTEFPEREGEEKMERAIRYADAAVGEMVSRLKAKGQLDKTLLLFTSDESLGLPRTVDGQLRWMAGNWSFLLVQGPQVPTGVVPELFMHADLAISLADVLLVDDGTLPFGGRSIFRTYQRGRDIAFANTYHRAVTGVRADGTAWRCKEFFDQCVRWTPKGHSLYAPGASREEAVPVTDAGWLEAIAAYSRRRY
jgi:arylsulfatase A-like enzyme